MNVRDALHRLVAWAVIIGCTGTLAVAAASRPHPAPPSVEKRRLSPHPGAGALADDPTPPDEPVKLIFIHHSCGGRRPYGDTDALGAAQRVGLLTHPAERLVRARSRDPDADSHDLRALQSHPAVGPGLSRRVCLPLG